MAPIIDYYSSSSPDTKFQIGDRVKIAGNSYYEMIDRNVVCIVTGVDRHLIRVKIEQSNYEITNWYKASNFKLVQAKNTQGSTMLLEDKKTITKDDLVVFDMTTKKFVYAGNDEEVKTFITKVIRQNINSEYAVYKPMYTARAPEIPLVYTNIE